MKRQLLFAAILFVMNSQLVGQTQLITNGNFSGSGGWDAQMDFHYGTTFSTCPCGSSPCYGYAYVSDPSGLAASNLVGTIQERIILQQTYSSAILSFCYNATSTTGASGYLQATIFIETTQNQIFVLQKTINGNLSGTTVTYTLNDPLYLQAGTILHVLFEGRTYSKPTTLRLDDVSFIAYPLVSSPAISLSGNLDFGNVQVGNSSQRTLTITNTGTASLNISTISYPSTVFTGSFNGVIAAGKSQNVTVTFTPSAATTLSGNVTVSSTAGTRTLPISGTGTSSTTSPDISLSGNLDFGNVQIGNSSQRTLTITNTGTATLNISSISYASTAFTGNFNGPIAAGASQNVTVTFLPSTATGYSGNVTVSSNAGSPTIPASGIGTNGPAAAMSLGGNLSFGNVQVGTSVQRTLTITNTGTAALDVTSISYPSSVFTGAYSGSIPVGGNKMVTVTFTPLSAIAYNGNITVTSSNGGSGIIGVSGTGLQITTYVISGKIKDVQVNVQTRTIDLMNYGGCIVRAYYAGTANVAGSAISTADGSFQITLPTSGNFDIKATDNAPAPNSVKLLNVATNSSTNDIKIPASLLQQITNAKNKLLNLSPTISSLGSTFLKFSHNVNPQNSIINQWENISENYSETIESASRLFVADSILRSFYLNADKINNEISTDIYEIAKAIFSFTKIFKKVDELTSNGPFDFFSDLIKDIERIVIDKLEDAIDQSFSFTSTESYGLKVFIIASLERFKHDAYGSDSYFTIVRPLIENIAASYVIAKEYIQASSPEPGSSQYALDYANSKALALSYTGDFDSHFVTVKNKIVAAEVAAEQVRIEAELHRDYSDIISKAGDAFSSTANIAGIFQLAPLAAFLKGVAFGGDIWSYKELSLSISKARTGFVNNKALLQSAATSVYKINSNYQKMHGNTRVDSIVESYNNQLNQLKSELISGNTQNVNNLAGAITASYKNLEAAIKEAFIPILSAAEQGTSQNPNFDSLIFNTFPHTLDAQPKVEMKFNLCYLAFMLNPSANDSRDSLINYINNLRLQNIYMRPEFDAAYVLIKDLPALNYIQSIKSDIPAAVEKGRQKICSVKFKNVGPADTKNLYAKLSFESPLTCNIDSIFIGKLSSGEIDSLAFTITAPLSDTTITYNIMFFAENTISDGFIGAIIVRARPNDPLLSYSSKGCFGDTVKLFAGSTSVDVHYMWTGPNGFSSHLQNPVIINASNLNSGNYTCFVEVNGLQSLASTVGVTINPPVTPTISISPTACSGSALTFGSSISGGGASPVYLWTVTASALTGTGPTFTIPNATNEMQVQCVLTSNAICTNPAQVVSQTFKVAFPKVAISGNFVFCQNSGTMLTASGANSYQWNTGQSSLSINVTNPGLYTVTGSSSGCKDTANVQVKMLPVPAINLMSSLTVHQGEPIRLGLKPVATGNAPLSFKWTPNYTLDYDTAQNPIIKPHFNTTYTLQVTDRNGCSNTKSIDILMSGFWIYPNPSNNIVNIHGSNIDPGYYSIKLLNHIGQVVYIEKLTIESGNLDKQISISRFPQGIYLLSIEGSGLPSSFRVLKN